MASDPVVERIALRAPPGARAQLGAIQWPAGTAPEVLPYGRVNPDSALPKVDVLVIPYTAAEKQATADVLSPGAPSDKWAKYAHNWETKFKSHTTGRSPSRDAGCMAYFQPVQIKGTRVGLLGSNLHWSTDDETIPVIALIQQAVEETGCGLVITTGTAGGGPDEVLGDVVVARNVKINAAGSRWAAEPWAQRSFPAAQPQATLFDTATALMGEAAYPHLQASGYAARPPQIILGKDCESIPTFGFMDAADSYGILKNDPNAGVEEMDDGMVALALSDLTDPPAWMSVRNASDPLMGGGSLAAQKQQASEIYSRFGYFTTVCSSIVCWAIIASS